MKRLTKRLIPTLLFLGVYLLLVGISPWKIAPYTDAFGLLFPIACIYFYICYRQCERLWMKYLCLIVALIAGVFGGFIKPNLYVVIIALLATEFILFLSDFKKWRFVVTEILLTAVLLFTTNLYKDNIIEEIGLTFNENINATWHHYFFMGLNEYTTGGYNAADVAVFGEFQNEDIRVRQEAELERAFQRLEERGVLGSIGFYLNKLVMTFNDASFGWRTEVWKQKDYPEIMKSNSIWAQRIRAIFLEEDGYGTWGYNTPCQFVWYFCILGIPGICLTKGKIREDYAIFVISFLGIFFYQMLFEARARYLFAYLPVILTISICGIQQYSMCLVALVKKLISKYKYGVNKKNESSENRDFVA